MTRFKIAALAAIAILSLAGCSKEDPNPELRDPIFKDLETRLGAHTKKVEESDKNLEGLLKKLEKSDANTLEKRDVERDIAKTKAAKLEAQQWARYYKIRLERRKFVDRIEYKKSLAKNEPWPDSREYSDYLTNRRLVESNRNWNTRVPKLVDRTAASVKSGENKGAPKGEGGGEAKPAAH